ncbi:hypothetical protein MycrhDRAFT_3665 [Mycolicibacterium rhodesiae JS60]|nr:hypothetical protein MycrhDRAFT_3665 [Mycolicibacterium rhodesiae JS60]
MLTETPLVVLRLYELAQVLGTVFGGYLVVRYGKSKFLAGLYGGCISIFFWDWIFTDSWFLNLTYDARSIILFTLDGRPEPLWSPASYATFFGITTMMLLRYRGWLDQRLGRWQYVALPAFFVVLDIAVEGFVIAALDIYRYGYQDKWMIFGVPYTNLAWVVIILMLMFWLGKGLVDLLHACGVRAVLGTPVSDSPSASSRSPVMAVAAAAGPDQPSEFVPALDKRESWAVFGLAFALCPAAFYVGVTVMTFVLKAIQPWS